MQKCSLPDFLLRCSFVAVFLAASVQAHALDSPVIINCGTATKLTLPTHVEFLFNREFGGESLSEAVAQCDAYRHAALAQIRDAELQPTDIRMTPVLPVSSCMVSSGILVQFSMSSFNTPSGAALFAALSDRLSLLASEMQASLEDPFFFTMQKEAIEAEVVARATENAFPHAEAVSEALKSTIYAIEKVEIKEVVWEQQPQKQYGESAQIGCTAKVQVTYMMTTQ